MNKSFFKSRNLFERFFNISKNYSMGLLNLKRSFNKKIFFISLWMNLAFCLYTKKFITRPQCATIEKEKKELTLKDMQDTLQIIQQPANNPIEDRYVAVSLKNFPGYFLAVLDGHGGADLAEFASQRLANYFDEIYQKLKKPELEMDHNAVGLALIETFEKIVI
jgi:hypothetical protein